MTMRSDLATHLRTALATAGHSLTVYDHKADIIDLPAVVIDRGEVRPHTAGGPGFLAWDVALHLVTSRAAPDEAEDYLEDLFLDTLAALATYRTTGNGKAGWSSFGRMEVSEINGMPALSGVVSATVIPAS